MYTDGVPLKLPRHKGIACVKVTSSERAISTDRNLLCNWTLIFLSGISTLLLTLSKQQQSPYGNQREKVRKEADLLPAGSVE